MENMTGRRCLVTGASSGIGRAAALELAQRGAELVLLCRNPDRGRATVAEIRAASGNDAIELLICDLASQAQIRHAAHEFLEDARPLHVLLNNAGVVNRRRRVTEDGLEETFAVNHLGYFLLTNLLLERLVASAPARIVNVSSDAHRFGTIDFDDLNAEGRYAMMQQYGRSKQANLLFTRELARRLAGRGVTVNALHPGFVGSGFATNNGLLSQLAMRLMRPFARTPEKGAETAVYLCCSAEVTDTTGEYFYDCRPHRPQAGAMEDPDARRLWQISEKLTGLAQA